MNVRLAQAGTVGLALLFAVPLAAEIPLPEIPAPQEAAQRLRQCGFDRVDVKFDEQLEEDVLTASGIEKASDEQIACAARVSSETYYYLHLPEEVQERFMAIYWPLEEAKGRERARQWLVEQGRLDDLPKYEPAVGEAAYARELEAFCGEVAEGALQSEYGPHAISPAWAAQKERDDTDFGRVGAAMMCLAMSGEVAGFTVYMIGNGKAWETDQR